MSGAAPVRGGEEGNAPVLAVLGAGGWGTALAVMACGCGLAVRLWSARARDLEEIRRYGEHRRLLPGVRVPAAVELTDELGACVRGAEAVLLAVPSFAVRETAAKLRGLLSPGQVVVNAAKGLEEETLKRLSQVIGEELPGSPVAVLSGPSHAEEVSRGIPTAVVAASADIASAERVQDLLMNPALRIYVNPDLVGVEFGGVFKNVIALAAGICDGLGLGDNSKAALMTRGITEMARLGVAFGGRSQTFAGLTGIGDLIVTCTSMHSRNRRAGILIGQGLAPGQAVEQVGSTVEGVRAARAVYRLAAKAGIEMPIVTECYRILYEGKNPRQAVLELMQRHKRHELEDAWDPEAGPGQAPPGAP